MASDLNDWLRGQSFRIGETRLRCPECADLRKGGNKRLREFSVRSDGEVLRFHCWHCGVKGALRLDGGKNEFRHTSAPGRVGNGDTNRQPNLSPALNSMSQREPERPPSGLNVTAIGRNITELSQEAADWLLRERGITLATAQKASLRGSTARRGETAVAFPYFYQGKVCGYKIRSIHDKRNMLVVGRLYGFFGQQLVSKDPIDPLRIVEGELDQLALMESGVDSAVSVPHGAIAETGAEADNSKLNCLTEAVEIFKDRKRIILAGDADGPGRATMDEISRRLGRWRSYMVDWPEGCKDGNDVLLKHGAEAVRAFINQAKALDIPGLYEASHFRKDLMRLRRGETGVGLSTGFFGVDNIFKVSPGVLTVVTGLPSSGKSSFVDAVHMNIAEENDWSFAMFSAENAPHYHIAKLVEKRARKRFYSNLQNVMTDDELEQAYDFVNNHFKFLTVGDEPATIESILDRMSAAVLRYGVRGAVIDPYNYITPSSDRREDLQISDLLSKCRIWAQNHETHLFLVAHPTKITTPGLVPDGNHISGGGSWRAKADFGLTVHRQTGSTVSEIHCWKVRYEHLGKEGMSELEYNKNTACYEDNSTSFHTPGADPDTWEVFETPVMDRAKIN